MKISIIIIALAIVGCVKDMEEKVICDNWESPWADWAHIEEGTIRYTFNWQKQKFIYRKMKDGESCRIISRYK